MKTKIAILSIFLLTTLNAYAQFPEDALRLAQPGYGVSAQSMSMGNAMTGLSEGYDAAYFNPAGLAQSYQSEFEMGLNFLGYNNNANYLGSPSSLSSSQTDLSNLGVVYPFPTTKGSFVIALGYNRENDFNTALSFNAYNPNSSIVPSLYYYNNIPYDVNYDIPYYTGLEDSATQRIALNKNVQQNGTVYESGGLNNYLIAGAVDIAQDFSIGLTLNLLSGSYHYARQFTETDPSGYWANIQLSDLSDAVGLQSFVLNDNVDQDLSGWNAKVGFLYRLADESGKVIARFGGTIEFPTFMAVDENYSDEGTYVNAAGALVGLSPYTTPGGSNNYDVTTPFEFGFGASGEISLLTIAADVQYVDWTQLQFSTSSGTTLPSDFINSLNSQIKQEFRATASLRGGAELALMNPDYSLLVPYIRAGVEYLPSPYAGDGSPQAQKIVSGGVGIKIQNSINLDVAYQYGWWNTSEQLYLDPNTNVSYETASKVTNTNFMFTFKYDF
ncbi:MAG: OmpP1/FadL family transporter [Candidatus Kryptoniota bacterium]